MSRLPINETTITQRPIANVLGVRRSAATKAGSHGQVQQLIHFTRGHIQALSRPGLKAVACQCDAAEIATHERQLGID